MYPSWWDHGVRVVGHDGQTGILMVAGNGGWLVQLDAQGDGNGYIVEPDAMAWRPEVRQRSTRGQLDRIVHDAEGEQARERSGVVAVQLRHDRARVLHRAGDDA